MQSHEVLKRAADKIGVKALANTVRVSPALVYKWCQEYNPDDPDTSGARNPLDRLADILRASDDMSIVHWLCHEAGGFFVPDPPSRDQPGRDAELLHSTQRLVREFSQLLITVTRSIEDDGSIEPDEADRIRDKWELFKSTVEEFTVACERGSFDSNMKS